jgi:hypothetical protein
LETESSNRYRKYKESAHKACLKTPISQPSVDISAIWIPLISDEVTKSKVLSWHSDSPLFIPLIHRTLFSVHYLSSGKQLTFLVPSFFSQFLYMVVRDLVIVLIRHKIVTSRCIVVLFCVCFQTICLLLYFQLHLFDSSCLRCAYIAYVI